MRGRLILSAVLFLNALLTASATTGTADVRTRSVSLPALEAPAIAPRRLKKLTTADKRLAMAGTLLVVEGAGLAIAGQRYGMNYGFGKRGGPKQEPAELAELESRKVKITHDHVNKGLGVVTALAVLATGPVILANAALMPGPSKPQHKRSIEPTAGVSLTKRRVKGKTDWDKHSQRLELSAGIMSALTLPLSVALYQKTASDYAAKHPKVQVRSFVDTLLATRQDAGTALDV